MKGNKEKYTDVNYFRSWKVFLNWMKVLKIAVSTIIRTK